MPGDAPRTWPQAASVLYDELVGTAAADFPDSLRDLLQRVSLGDDWLVVGLDLAGSYRTSWGAVLAVPMPASGRFVSWASLVESGGGTLSVRRFPVPQKDISRDVPGALGLLTHLKRWSVRLVIAPLRGVPIEVLVDG